MTGARKPLTMVLFLLFSTALGGCMGDGPQDDGAAASDGDEENRGNFLEIPWGLHSCRASWWLAPANAQALRAYLPEGFEPAGGTQLPGIDVVAGLDTYLGFDAFQCQSGAGPNGTIEPVTFGSLFTRVTPPDEYTAQGLDPYFFRWEVLVPDQARFERFADLGLPVRQGDAQVQAMTAAGSPGPWENTLDLEGSGTFTFTGTTTAPPGPSDGVTYAAFTPAGDDVATWRATATNITEATGWGVWTAEPGSWVADVLEAEQGEAVFSVGTWSVTDASIRIPVQSG